MDRHITLYHAPHSRSNCARWMLEELGIDYNMHVVDLDQNEQRGPDYTAINPMGKVPAIRHRGTLVTEQAAVCMYLAELFPEAGLAPPLGDTRRGSYLRWMVLYGSCFEPAVIDRSKQRTPVPPRLLSYGDFDTVWNTLVQQLRLNLYIAGDSFTAADVVWGASLGWVDRFKLIPDDATVKAYVNRVNARPAAQRARALDDALVKQRQAA